MLKDKIRNIIYSDDFSDDELERYCYYYRGDRYDYGTYGAGYYFRSTLDEIECYNKRIRRLADKVIENGAEDVFNLNFCETSLRMNRAVLKFLLTLTKDTYTIKYLNNYIKE